MIWDVFTGVITAITSPAAAVFNLFAAAVRLISGVVTSYFEGKILALIQNLQQVRTVFAKLPTQELRSSPVKETIKILRGQLESHFQKVALGLQGHSC